MVTTPVVMSLLHLLRLDEVHHSVDPLPHLTHMFDGGLVYHPLLFPGPLGNVKQTAGLSTEEQLERGKAGGGLRDLSNTEEHVGEHLVPIPLIFGCHSAQYLFEGLVKAINEAIGLGVVHHGAELLDLQEFINIHNHLGHEGGALVSQDLRRAPL